MLNVNCLKLTALNLYCAPMWFDCTTTSLIKLKVVGYEPADLTVHPPPQNYREWVHFFRIGV